MFIQFPKPIIAAVNGPGIGAGATAPALCDTIIASERATFSTPFKLLGVGPEGCSSVHFERFHQIIQGEASQELPLTGHKRFQLLKELFLAHPVDLLKS